MSTVLYHHVQFMHPRLESKYLQLEKSRNLLLNELEVLDNHSLNRAPGEGKWSVNQIISHLILVEELTLGYVQKKLEKENELQHSSIANELKALLLKLALKSGMKFKAPPAVAGTPEKAPLSTLRHKWDEIRFKMEDVLTELPPHHLNKCLFRHPYAGLLTINQTLHFLQDHFDHHQHQIEVLKKQF